MDLKKGKSQGWRGVNLGKINNHINGRKGRDGKEGRTESLEVMERLSHRA